MFYSVRYACASEEQLANRTGGQIIENPNKIKVPKRKERIAVEASVMMYEWCEDLNELTGKKYQDIAQRLLSQAALAKTRIARKKLADFFKQEKPVLSEIRHNAGAHREHDFMKQMEVLEGVGWSGTIDRLHRFEEVTLELGKTMKPLMEAGLKKIGEAFGK